MLISSGDKSGSSGRPGQSRSSDEVSSVKRKMRRKKVIEIESIKYFLRLNTLMRIINICVSLDY